MSGWIDQLLPSLGSLGVWTYWIVGAAAMLEAWFVTGVVAPGTLIVDAGGALVRLGKLDFFDLVWFVAIGSALGGELGFWTGRHAGRLLKGRWDPSGSKAYRKAETLFARRGGMALVIGRFLGPVAGLASFVAAMAGMETRRFRIWNIISAIPYAFAHVAIGYAAGDILSRIGPQLTRVALFAAALAAVFAVIWLVARHIRRGLPLLLAGLGALRDLALRQPVMVRLMRNHPRATAFVEARVRTDRLSGLTATVLAAVFLYLCTVWADTVLDFLFTPQVAETDLRVARLLHAFWSPVALKIFGLITQLGHWPVVTAVFLGAAAALVATRRYAALAQLVVALGGEVLTVRLLKMTFARPRPELSYFVETSGSFPSGHATLSVAFWGTLCVILWRERLLDATVALVSAAVLAFLIGFSRLYLVVHFFSDVVNGWLLGGMWLVIGFTVAEVLRDRGWNGRRPGSPPLAAALLAVGVCTAGWLAVTADPPRPEASAAAEPKVIDPVAALGSDSLPVDVQTIDGEHSLPVPLIFAAKDLDAVEAALSQAGWQPVDRPTPTALLRAAWADWTGKLDATAPLLPLFWRSSPQDAGWRSPDGTVELRLWQADARTGSGAMLIAGALSPGGEATGTWTVGDAAGALLDKLTGAPVQRVATQADSGEAPGGRDWRWDGRVAVVTLGG